MAILSTVTKVAKFAGKTVKNSIKASKQMASSLDDTSKDDMGQSTNKSLIWKIIIGISVLFLIMSGGFYETGVAGSVSSYSSAQHVNSYINTTSSQNEKNNNIVSESSFGFLFNFFGEEEYGSFNREKPLEEALIKLTELLDISYENAKTKIKEEYLLPSFEKAFMTQENSEETSGDSQDMDAQSSTDYLLEELLKISEEDNETVSMELTSISLDEAMRNSGNMDYAFIICALSLREEFQYGNILSYKEIKDYISDDSILFYLCNYTYEKAYGYIGEDGLIVKGTKDDGISEPYIRTIMQPCTVRNVFDMIGLIPDEPSSEVPAMTNYELTVYRKNALKGSYAQYFNFGNAEIDYTLDDNYRTAMMTDFHCIETELKIPLYHQEDYPKSPYGSSTVASSGCGPTSMAMITSYLTGFQVTPDEIGSDYGSYYVDGQGSSHQLFYAVAKDNGYNCKQLSLNAQSFINELNAGNPVIVTVTAGTFTKGGHIMVLRGITSDGYFLINDPNGYNLEKYMTDAFSINTVMLDARHAYAFYKEKES